MDHELAELHNQVAPVSLDALLPQVEQVLGRSPSRCLTSSNANPSRQPRSPKCTGRNFRTAAVILKIRRPGIEAKIDADLRILTHLAQLVEQEMPETRRYLPVQVVSQLRRSLERELDLSVEARNTERFARNLPTIPTSSSHTSTANGRAV